MVYIPLYFGREIDSIVFLYKWFVLLHEISIATDYRFGNWPWAELRWTKLVWSLCTYMLILCLTFWQLLLMGVRKANGDYTCSILQYVLICVFCFDSLRAVCLGWCQREAWFVLWCIWRFGFETSLLFVSWLKLVALLLPKKKTNEREKERGV